jgi:hypothetical protein
MTFIFPWPVLRKLQFSLFIKLQQEAAKHLTHLFTKCPHHVSLGRSHERGRYRWGSGKYAGDKIAITDFGGEELGGNRQLVKSKRRVEDIKMDLKEREHEDVYCISCLRTVHKWEYHENTVVHVPVRVP